MTKHSDFAPPPAALWARVGHDLRQPIQSLLLLTHVLSGTADAAQRAETGHLMEDALLGLQDMLDTVALVARLEAGAEAVQAVECSLPAVVAHVASLVAETGRELRVQAKARPAVAITDSRLLEKAVLGLLFSAHAARTGDAIELGCRNSAGVSRIEIVFNGPPQPAGNRSALFAEMRDRAPRAKPYKHCVVGFGLAERIVTLLGAQLESRSLAGERQVFSIAFPAQP